MNDYYLIHDHMQQSAYEWLFDFDAQPNVGSAMRAVHDLTIWIPFGGSCFSEQNNDYVNVAALMAHSMVRRTLERNLIRYIEGDGILPGIGYADYYEVGFLRIVPAPHDLFRELITAMAFVVRCVEIGKLRDADSIDRVIAKMMR